MLYCLLFLDLNSEVRQTIALHSDENYIYKKKM